MNRKGKGEKMNSTMKKTAIMAAALIITTSVWSLSSGGTMALAAESTGESEISWPVKISEETFPDEAFRQYVSTHDDIDKNGELSQSEADKVTEIRISNNRAVTSLEGIEYFSKLENLYCDGDSISALNVGGNSELRTLNCSDNNISELDLTKNSCLESLECFKNGLSTLNLSGNPELTHLLCGGDKLKDIDISANPKLNSFAYLAGGLRNIDFSNNPQLQQIWISGTPLESLDVSHNPQLTSLLVYITNIQTVDLTNNPLLTAGNVNLHSDKLISIHTAMKDASSMYLSTQRPVTVKVPAGTGDYDLRNLDPAINSSSIQGLDGVVIENAIVKDVYPGREISYNYSDNGAEFTAHIRFVEDDTAQGPTGPDDPQEPPVPDKPQEPESPQNPTEPGEPVNPEPPAISGGTVDLTKQENAKVAETPVKTSDESIPLVVGGIVIISALGTVIFAATGKRKNR